MSLASRRPEESRRQRLLDQRGEALALLLRGVGQRPVEPGVDAEDELPGIGLVRGPPRSAQNSR